MAYDNDIVSKNNTVLETKCLTEYANTKSYSFGIMHTSHVPNPKLGDTENNTSLENYNPLQYVSIFDTM